MGRDCATEKKIIDATSIPPVPPERIIASLLSQIHNHCQNGRITHHRIRFARVQELQRFIKASGIFNFGAGNREVRVDFPTIAHQHREIPHMLFQKMLVVAQFAQRIGVDLRRSSCQLIGADQHLGRGVLLWSTEQLREAMSIFSPVA